MSLTTAPIAGRFVGFHLDPASIAALGRLQGRYTRRLKVRAAPASAIVRRSLDALEAHMMSLSTDDERHEASRFALYRKSRP